MWPAIMAGSPVRALGPAPTRLVLDVHLGGMSGFDLQQHLATAGIPIPTIFITALTYLPGKGTALQVADKELAAFDWKGFADAVFSIWLGPKPPSEDLRNDPAVAQGSAEPGLHGPSPRGP